MIRLTLSDHSPRLTILELMCTSEGSLIRLTLSDHSPRLTTLGGSVYF